MGALEFGEEIAEKVGDLERTEVDGSLAAIAAECETVVGTETFSGTDSPVGYDGALGGEKPRVGKDEGAGTVEAGLSIGGRLVNRVAFFRGWVLWWGSWGVCLGHNRGQVLTRCRWLLAVFGGEGVEFHFRGSVEVDSRLELATWRVGGGWPWLGGMWSAEAGKD